MKNDPSRVARLKLLAAKAVEMAERDQWDAGRIADAYQAVNDHPPLLVEPTASAEPKIAANPASRVIAGSELVLGVEECNRFLRDFGGVKGVDCAKMPQSVRPTDRPHWSYPVLWTLEELIGLIEKRSVRRWDWTVSQMRRVKVADDTRRPTKPGRLVHTPAGLESNEANPEFVGVSYRRLQSREFCDRANTVTEAVHLWTLVDFISGGDLALDVVSWNRTCSRRVDGYGLDVDGLGRRLNVRWGALDSVIDPGSSRPVI